MINKKLPKTHTIFGVKCKLIYFGSIRNRWEGENSQFAIEVYDRHLTYRNPNDKQFLVYVTLKTFHQVQISGTGDTLKEAQQKVEQQFEQEVIILDRIYDKIYTNLYSVHV
jgi:hypothetical protein